MPFSPVALEFARHVMQQYPGLSDFASWHIAMARVASGRSFHGMGYSELAEIGISFSLSGLSVLEELIKAVNGSISTPEPHRFPDVRYRVHS
jgi:hypothetical protein